MNPAVLPFGFSHNEYLEICYKMIDCCDAVYLMKGWSKSLGARTETLYADSKGIKLVSYKNKRFRLF